MSSSFAIRFSLCVSIVGNFPALLSPGPRRRGICFIKVSEAINASYFFAEKSGKEIGQDLNSYIKNN